MILLPLKVDSVARRDLRELTLWLRNEADVETARRFATSVITCFDKIAESPSIGPLVPTANPLLSGVRKWKVPGFHSHLIFYRPTPQDVRIIRVLHAAQDWWALLEVN